MSNKVFAQSDRGRFVIRVNNIQEWIEETNKNKITDEQLAKCREIAKLFKKEVDIEDETI